MQWDITQPLKKNEIMPFAATWMDLEIVIVSEVSQTEKEKYCMTSLYRNLKRNDTNELTQQRDSQTQRMNLWLLGKKIGERDRQGVWDGQVHTAIFKMDNQQGSTVQHMEICYMAAQIGGEFRGEWIQVYVWQNSFAVFLKLSQHCLSTIPQHKIKSLKIKKPVKFDLADTFRYQALVSHLSIHPIFIEHPLDFGFCVRTREINGLPWWLRR